MPFHRKICRGRLKKNLHFYSVQSKSGSVIVNNERGLPCFLFSTGGSSIIGQIMQLRTINLVKNITKLPGILFSIFIKEINMMWPYKRRCPESQLR